jgi:hypothetical protein
VGHGDGVLEDADLSIDLDLVAGSSTRRGAPRADAAGRAGDRHAARDKRGPAETSMISI